LATRLLIDDCEVASTETATSRGINRSNLEFSTESLGVGQHQLRLNVLGKSLSYSEEMRISTYDLNQFSEMKASIDRLKELKASAMEIAESIATLEYLLETSMRELKRLKPYLSFDGIQNTLDRIQDGISRVEANESLFAKGKPTRMGLRSVQDHSLQPYSLYIPKTFRQGSGGLVVLLHGSGSNDAKMLAKSSVLEWLEETGIIAVAPFARGESHFYLPKEALGEIAEVTEKMMKMFSIPKEKVVLAGFSMGGFGVINTYFFRPNLYRNLMVISGKFKLYAPGPDWSTDAALKKLATTNLIIFHGDADLNVPYKEQKPIHNRLKQLNPNVEIVIAKGVGHQEAPEWKEKIVEYLNKVTEE
jgi:predicted esterase